MSPPRAFSPASSRTSGGSSRCCARAVTWPSCSLNSISTLPRSLPRPWSSWTAATLFWPVGARTSTKRMYDGASLSEPRQLQRAVADLRVAVKRRDGETVLDELRQAGCLKARFPRPIVPGWLDAVVVNTGGGVAGGDRLQLGFYAGAATRTTVSAQAAERFYRARSADSPSQVSTHLTIASGAVLEWLPQETILFDQSSVNRSLHIDLAPDACFLGVETLVFGRSAMGETMGQGRLRDLIRITRAGALLLHDAIRID